MTVQPYDEPPVRTGLGFTLHHVQLAIPADGEDAARRFWVDVIGLTEVAKPAALAARGGLWVRSDGFELHLGVDPDVRPQRKAHPGIAVADLDGLAERVRAAGHPVRPDDDFPGRRRVLHRRSVRQPDRVPLGFRAVGVEVVVRTTTHAVGSRHVIEEMTALGFTGAEAKVYVALLRRPDSTGYEIAKEAGLQRANVYAALPTLVARDCVVRTEQDGAPGRYRAAPPAEVFGRIKRSTSRRADALIADLATVTTAPSTPAFHTLTGLEAIIDRAAVMIDAAQESIGVSAWADDLAWLAGPLQGARRAGRRIVINLFGETDLDLGEIYHHEAPERTVGGHGLSLVCDARTSMIATLGDAPTAVCTDQPAIVQLVAKVIRDEAYLAAIFASHRDELERTHGPPLVELRRRLLPDDQAAALLSIVGFGAAGADPSLLTEEN